MCRFFCYLGAESLLFDAMYNAENSLIEQSKSAKKRRRPVNGDGFGVGWYPTHDDPEPGTFVAVDPAWNDRNLHNFCAKIKTSCFFAHVRDASSGMPVSMANCHPFQYGPYLWMHNGFLEQFDKIKRPIINQLSERAFLQVKGNTDAEHAFAMFLDEIQFKQDTSGRDLELAMIRTIKKIMRIRKIHNANTGALMNFVVTNGKSIVSTRFATHKATQPPSLFFTKASMQLDQTNKLRLNKSELTNSLIISSEPITNGSAIWTKVDRSQLVVADQDYGIVVKPLPVHFQDTDDIQE